METKEVELPSGRKAKITPSPFKVSKKLYKAVLSEAKQMNIDPRQEVDINLLKDILCSLITSDEVENRVLECAQRVVYNDSKISIAARDLLRV